MNKTEVKLKKELDHLKKKYNDGHDLKVKYLPKVAKRSENGTLLYGELSNDFIFIYAGSEDLAVKTLRHEFIEYIVYPYIKDYINIINDQSKMLSELLYKRKEELVEKFTKML